MKMTSSKMRKNFTPVFLPVMSVLLVLASVYSSFVSKGISPALAAAPGQAQAPMRWIEPIDLSNSHWYDNTSSLAASPVNGAVTVAWEQRDETIDHTFGQIM